MKILGIESASTTASAALIDDGVLLSECTSNYKKTHSETLLPMISEVLSMTETEPKEMRDYGAESLREIYNKAMEEPEYVKSAPSTTPIGRPDEVKAARKPVVKYEFQEA